jgi:hypothetical protein
MLRTSPRQHPTLKNHIHYVNPGSLGCAPQPLARYTLAEFKKATYTIQHHSVPYDDSTLWPAFEARQVPERHFLARAFFAGRFP